MREKKTERDAYIRTHLHAGLWRLKAFAVKTGVKRRQKYRLSIRACNRQNIDRACDDRYALRRGDIELYECMCVCDKCVLDEGIKFINHFSIFIS